MKPELVAELAEEKVAFALSPADIGHIHGRRDSLDPGPDSGSDLCLFLCLYPYNDHDRGHDLYHGRAPSVYHVHYSVAGLV
jgi:hypothetical protein